MSNPHDYKYSQPPFHLHSFSLDSSLTKQPSHHNTHNSTHHNINLNNLNMVWQKDIRPTRENSNLPLYDNTPEASTESEPLSRREQRRLRRQTTRTLSEVAQVATADNPENEAKVREPTKKTRGAADKEQEQEGQDEPNTAAETTGESSKDSPPSDTPGPSSSDPEAGNPQGEDGNEEMGKEA